MRKVTWICWCYVLFLFVGGIGGTLAGSKASLFSAGGAALVLAWLCYQMTKNRMWAFWIALAQVGSLTLFFGVRFWYTNGGVPLICSIVSLLVFLLMVWFQKNRCPGDACGNKSK